MNVTWLEFCLLFIASFRLTRLFVYDKITESFRSLFLKEVEETEEDGKVAVYYVPKEGLIRRFFGELLSCYWCTGVWSSIFFTLLYYFFPIWGGPFVLVFAIAGAAALIETFVQLLLDKM